MSSGPWKRCPTTEIPLNRHVDEEYLTHEGGIDVGHLDDCNLFTLRDFAHAAGFSNPVYFRRRVLEHPASTFHFYKECVRDSSGSYVGTYYATHVNSADAGGRTWRQMQTQAARQRVSWTDQTSGSVISC